MEGLVLASIPAWNLAEPSVEVPSGLAVQSIVYSESVPSMVATVETAVPFEKSAFYPGFCAWNASYWNWVQLPPASNRPDSTVPSGWVLARCS